MSADFSKESVSAARDKRELLRANSPSPDHERGPVRRSSPNTRFVVVLVLVPLCLLLARALLGLIEFVPFVGGFLASFEPVAAFFLLIGLGIFAADAVKSLDSARLSQKALVLVYSFLICSLMFAAPYVVGYYKFPVKIGRAAVAEKVDLTYAEASQLVRNELREQTGSDGILSYAIYVERRRVASGSVVTYAADELEGVDDPVSLVLALFNILLSAAPVLLTWIFSVQLGWVSETGHLSLTYWYLVALSLCFGAYLWNRPAEPVGPVGRSTPRPPDTTDHARMRRSGGLSSLIWLTAAALVLIVGIILFLQYATKEIGRSQAQDDRVSEAGGSSGVAENPADWTVTLSGLGAIKVGTTRKALEIATGSRLTKVSELTNGTPLFDLSGLPDATVALAEEHVKAIKTTGSWRTRSGLKVGDTEAQVLRLYGEKVVLRQGAKGAGLVYEFVPRDEQDARLRVIFAMSDGRVSAICAGELPEVAELCGIIDAAVSMIPQVGDLGETVMTSGCGCVVHPLLPDGLVAADRFLTLHVEHGSMSTAGTSCCRRRNVLRMTARACVNPTVPARRGTWATAWRFT